MKAIAYHAYGLPDVLALEDVPKPVPKDDEVLVRVLASSVNSWDWDLLAGRPYVYRLMFGLTKPRYRIIGSDIAGRVEVVGKAVTGFSPGDEVFGDISGRGFGGFAEYACAREDQLALKSAGMTFEEAAAMPQAAVLALQGLRYNGEIRKGQKVLINGAGGGVGTFAIQLARLFGAEVTGVDKREKWDTMLSLGAHRVIDFQDTDFAKEGQRYDLIIDVMATRSIFDCKKVLNPGGAYGLIGGLPKVLLQFALLGAFISGSDRKMGVVVHRPGQQDLSFVAGLYETGKLVPIIDTTFPLSDVPDALAYFGTGRATGKIVITV